MADPISILREWVESVTSLQVIYADDPEPAAPRPTADGVVQSYAAIGIDSDQSEYSTAHQVTEESGGVVTQKRSTLRAGTLAVEFYGADAADYARALDLSRCAQATSDLLKTWGEVSLGASSQVTDTPVLRSAEREPNASITIDITWVDTLSTVLTQYAETADSTATVEDPS